MKYYIIVLSFLLTFPLYSQEYWNDVISVDQPENIRLSSLLYQLGEVADLDLQVAKSKSSELELVKKLDSVYVDIQYSWDENNKIEDIDFSKYPLRINNRWKNRASAWVALKDIKELGNEIDDNILIRHVQNFQDNQGPALMNSNSYINNSSNGNGINIAIIDVGFSNVNDPTLLGLVPSNIIQYDWVGNGIEGSTHGTNCLETVFDHAPGSTYFIHKVSSIADLGNAVDQAIEDDCHIISHSMSKYNTGWEDDSGGACNAAEDAVNNNILFFTSAGNRNVEHWQGFFSGSDSEHNWSGTDEKNDFFINPNRTIFLRLQWNASPDPVADDYDLFLRRSSDNAILASSTSAADFEALSFFNSSSQSMQVYIEVIQDGTDNNEFEVFKYNQMNNPFEYSSSSNSTTSPSNTTHENVISVGAIDTLNYINQNGIAGPLMFYSSLGPTNEGGNGVDICGPTNTTTSTGTFNGTSCATPNVAGAAAALWSNFPNLGASSIRKLLFKQASIYGDGSDVGFDNNYGWGALFLHSFKPDMIFLDQQEGINNLFPSNLIYAWDNLKDIDALSPPNKTVIMLTDDLISAPTVLDKEMLIMAAGKYDSSKVTK